MKKSCFLSVIIVLTIFLAIVFYLIKFHGNELIDYGKGYFVEFTYNKVFEDLDNLEDKKYVDSLKIVIDNYFINIDSLEVEDELQHIEEFTNNIDVILKDSKIDSLEFEFITKILVNYEKRKEN